MAQTEGKGVSRPNGGFEIAPLEREENRTIFRLIKDEIIFCLGNWNLPEWLHLTYSRINNNSILPVNNIESWDCMTLRRVSISSIHDLEAVDTIDRIRDS